SFRADGEIESETEHGAGCAEIVYDIAPDAAYYFVNYGTDTEYFNAVDYLESESVDVVSHSISWFLSGAYDGSSDVSQRIDTARSNGIFWANSAGNYADQHWEGYFDNDGSGNHIWDSGSGATVNELGLIGSGVTVTAYLSWDNWVPLSTNDYDMYLMYSTGGDWSVEASSTTDQSTGDQPPTEDISYKTDKLGFYGLLVTKVSGSDQYLDLFTTRQSLEYPVAMGSVPNAADAAGAITVAAVDASDYNATGLESYSSHGPTNATGGGEPNYGNGSYTKPDISGPDKVSTVTYGTLGFGGTSASTPHTAGAATLYMSGYNNAYGALPTVSQTQTYLENCAEEKYDWGTDTDGIKNNQFGAGGLYMCQTPTAVRVIELYALNAVNLTLQALAASVAFILIVAGLIGYHARKKEVKTN
ncbi:MAG: S8 family serine peptidase, partial [Chloroflexota bacterium]|nr:S8 family serine peptidase [Chloroflexota bacterium]